MSALLDRLERLLRLATSSNPHEAAAAAARAQAMIEKHRIDEALVAVLSGQAPEIVDDRDHPLDESKRLRPWKVALAGAIAEANGCGVYVLDGGRHRDAVRKAILVGRAENFAAVRALYADLVVRIEALTRTFGQGRSRDWATSFRFGVVDTLGDRLLAARISARREAIEGEVAAPPEVAPMAGSPLTTLMRVPDAVKELERQEAAVEAWMSKHLGAGKGRGTRVLQGAFAAGRAAGHDLDWG